MTSRVGMSPMQTMLKSNRHLEPEKFAEILIVSGNTLED